MAPKNAPQINPEQSNNSNSPERYTYIWEMPGKGIFRRSERVSAYQTEITLGQEVELLQFLYRYDLATLEDFKQKFAQGNLLQRLIETGEIYHLFQILLRPDLSEAQVRAMPLTIQMRVIADFFELNPGAALLLRSFFAARESSRENPTPADNASPPKES